MFEPLRFLHVADAGLDQPLGDLGPLSEPWQSLVEDAALIAFEQMIAGAISENVDCVLLAGNTFHEADQSLRARLKLLDGLGKLNEHDISVFVLPGPRDPASAWRDIPNLPGNVTLLTSGEADDEESQIPVAILREGRVIATITAGTLSQLSAESEADSGPESHTVGPVPSENGHPRSSPFRMGMLTAWPARPLPQNAAGHELADQLSACGCDYLAVPESDPSARQSGWWFEAGLTLNTRDGIAHHPGRLQAISARETGPHGATLIEVDTNGEIRGTFLPFACVRRLRLEVPVEPNATLEDIAEAMSRRLLEETEQAGEHAWFVTWILQGGGTFFESLGDLDLQSQLIDALPDSQGPNGCVSIHHRLQFQESPPPMADEEAVTDLERLYREALDNLLADDPAVIQLMSHAALSDITQLKDAHWRERLLPLVVELDPNAVMAKARSLGREWFREGSDD